MKDGESANVMGTKNVYSAVLCIVNAILHPCLYILFGQQREMIKIGTGIHLLHYTVFCFHHFESPSLPLSFQETILEAELYYYVIAYTQ